MDSHLAGLYGEKDKSEKRMNNLNTDLELDRVAVANTLLERQKRYNWHPGEPSMSEIDIKEILDTFEDMKIEEYLKEVAATVEDDDDKILG